MSLQAWKDTTALCFGLEIWYFYTQVIIETDLTLLEGGRAVVEVWSPLRLEGLGGRLHVGQRLEVRTLGAQYSDKNNGENIDF